VQPISHKNRLPGSVESAQQRPVDSPQPPVDHEGDSNSSAEGDAHRLRNGVIAIQRKLLVHPAEHVRDPRAQPGGQRPARGGRGTTQPVARWRGPQKCRRHQRDARGHRPAG